MVEWLKKARQTRLVRIPFLFHFLEPTTILMLQQYFMTHVRHGVASLEIYRDYISSSHCLLLDVLLADH